ncbi:tripartite tricarboxylate transporter substrate binding protein [Variovorax defluvii]|uniref:Tripartite tricarboxylate transporter substrate binding protein n=1 Tax=Variovorax defluvii TaxID=913761 RepID=A0ABP8IDV7_9BURK
MPNSTLNLRMTRRQAIGATLATGATLLHGSPALAQADWPTKPVTLVVGYPPGGQTDFIARALTAGLQSSLGQPVIVDNKAGANGAIGSEYVLQAPADGYRLLAGNVAITIAPHVYTKAKMPDPLKFTPIGTMLTSGLVLLVPATSPVKDFKQFVQMVKETKGGIDYATSGAGGITHVTTEILRERLGKPSMNHVAYKGSGPAAMDLIAGRVAAMFDAVSVVSPFIKSGQLRAIMTTSKTRVPALPDVPTAAECGLKDFEIYAFIGLYGPPNLPPAIIKRANAALNTALVDPATRKAILERGDEPGGGTPEALANMTRDYHAMFGKIVKENNIQAD